MKISCGKISILQTVGKVLPLIIVMSLISACSTMPDSIQGEHLTAISVQEVQQNTADHQGEVVRWGGVITQVINHEDDTWIEVLALELNIDGRPTSDRINNQGRFIAKIDQFLDPQVYQTGNSLTVIGILNDKIDGKIGEYNYSFPVVTVQGHHLWRTITQRAYRYISPGYWYYGHHQFWHFGYSYYGFGVRHHIGYYPYYPIYGHLQRRSKPLPHRISGVFSHGADHFWPENTQQLFVANPVRMNRYPVRTIAQTSDPSSTVHQSSRHYSSRNVSSTQRREPVRHVQSSNHKIRQK